MAAELQIPLLRFPDGSGRSLSDVVSAAPPGAVVEIAPGRYFGPLSLSRAVSLRGAGDLTRIMVTRGSVVQVSAPEEARVVLESLLLEGGDAEAGGGLLVRSGRVRLHNVQIQRCAGGAGGGAIHVVGGEVDGSLLRLHDVSAERGGALWVKGSGALRLRDSQIARAEARFGGAAAVEEGARMLLEGVSVRRCRATASSGGQAIWVGGTERARPSVFLRRVRLEDAPMGMPVVIDGRHPGEVSIAECDLPRVVLGAPGVSDGGNNRWR